MSTPDSVSFFVNGRRCDVSTVQPTRTVLRYLREDLGLTGTKEGCAEGDCGACTVAISEVDADGRLRVRAVNSCIQFVPTLAGKEVITVEGLATGNDLHPVQQAMVDYHASQCGFCTPGFVMTLFALFKSDIARGRKTVVDQLAGNLCRCTGYRPIIEAAMAMDSYAPAANDNGSWLRTPGVSAVANIDEADRVQRLLALTPAGLEPAGGAYRAPTSLATCAELVERFPAAQLLAGGTDVGLWVTKQGRTFSSIIYLGGVPELTTINFTDSHLEIGSAVTLTQLAPVLWAEYPTLEVLWRRFASPPIRNVATLGGNIANGSPIGDSMPALMAINTSLILRKGKHTRELDLDAFYLRYQKTALKPGEFIERIRIPRRPSGALRAYKISKRFDQDISAVCGAFNVTLDENHVVDIRIAYGGMAATPKRAIQAENTLVGKTWTEAEVRKGMSALEQDFAPLTDLRASAWYRAKVAQHLLYRYYLETVGRESSLSLYE